MSQGDRGNSGTPEKGSSVKPSDLITAESTRQVSQKAGRKEYAHEWNGVIFPGRGMSAAVKENVTTRLKRCEPGKNCGSNERLDSS